MTNSESKTEIGSYRTRQGIRAVQFSPCGEHKMTLPPGVEVFKRPSHADNYCYEGFGFEVYPEGDNKDGVEIEGGDWLIYSGSSDKILDVFDDGQFRRIYEPADSRSPDSLTQERDALREAVKVLIERQEEAAAVSSPDDNIHYIGPDIERLKGIIKTKAGE